MRSLIQNAIKYVLPMRAWTQPWEQARHLSKVPDVDPSRMACPPGDDGTTVSSYLLQSEKLDTEAPWATLSWIRPCRSSKRMVFIFKTSLKHLLLPQVWFLCNYCVACGVRWTHYTHCMLESVPVTDFAHAFTHSLTHNSHGELPMKIASFLQQFHFTYHRQFSAESFAWSPKWQTALPAKREQSLYHDTSIK